METFADYEKTKREYEAECYRDESYLATLKDHLPEPELVQAEDNHDALVTAVLWVVALILLSGGLL